jgi:LysR family transcriptional regulator, regulator for bpeEF and oprC
VLTKSVARLILCQLCRRGRPALRRQSEDKLPSSRLEAARAKAKGVYAGKGVLLFARSTRTLKLTAEGARFHRDCVQILKKLEEATQQFRANRAVPHGRLKVGMGLGMSRRLLLHAIPPFQKQYPDIEIILLSIDENAQIGDKGVDVLLRPRSLRQRGGQHPEPQGLVVRKLVQARLVVCASPEYVDRAGAPRVPADLLRHACIAHVTLERDLQDEWSFVKSQVRQKVKFVPKLLLQGVDALREAGVAGCGIIVTGANFRATAWGLGRCGADKFGEIRDLGAGQAQARP